MDVRGQERGMSVSDPVEVIGTYQDLSLEMMCKSRSNQQIGLQGRVISGYMGIHNSYLACTQLPI
jgi:hypothetical protein